MEITYTLQAPLTRSTDQPAPTTPTPDSHNQRDIPIGRPVLTAALKFLCVRDESTDLENIDVEKMLYALEVLSAIRKLIGKGRMRA